MWSKFQDEINDVVCRMTANARSTGYDGYSGELYKEANQLREKFVILLNRCVDSYGKDYLDLQKDAYEYRLEVEAANEVNSKNET